MSTVSAVLPNPRTSTPAKYLRPEAFSPEGAGRARAPWLIAPGPSLGIPRLDHVGLRHSSFGSDAAAARFATTLIELGVGNPSDWSGCGREPASSCAVLSIGSWSARLRLLSTAHSSYR